MKTPEEVASDWLGAGVGARYFHHETLVPLIEADRKAVIAEFVREAICVECAQCASDGPDHESIYEHEGRWYHDCGGTTWACNAHPIRRLAREKGIDL